MQKSRDATDYKVFEELKPANEGKQGWRASTGPHSEDLEDTVKNMSFISRAP